MLYPLWHYVASHTFRSLAIAEVGWVWARMGRCWMLAALLLLAGRSLGEVDDQEEEEVIVVHESWESSMQESSEQSSSSAGEASESSQAQVTDKT